MTEYKRLIAGNAMDDLGEIPAEDVTDVQIARVLDKVAKRSPHQADRTRDAIRSTYAWAKGRKLVRSNPASGHAKRAVEIPRDRFYTTIELRKLTNMLRAEQSSVCTILRLLLLTGQREAMVAGAEVAELDTNLKTWIIAGDTSRGSRRIKGRVKKGREQIVPLSTQATELFQEALQTQRDGYVFPADLGRVPAKRVRPRTPSINGQSVSRALRKFNAALEIEDANVHDFRRTIARWLSDPEVRPDVIDAILAHAPRDVGGRHYGKRAPESMIRSALQL